MRLLQLLAKGAAKFGIAVELLLLLERLIEHRPPQLHVGERKRIAQIHLDDERLAQHLGHAAALDQRLEPPQRVGAGLGFVGAARHREPGDRPLAFVEQEFQQSLLVLRHTPRAPRERDFDRAAPGVPQHVGVRLQLIGRCQPARQRPPLVTDMLRQGRRGKSERARADRLPQQRRDPRRLRGRGLALHRFVAQHVMPKRSQRREERQVDSRAATRRRRQEIREALPLPRNPLRQRLEWNRLDVDQVPRRDLARRGLARRNPHSAISHHDGGDAVPRGATD